MTSTKTLTDAAERLCTCLADQVEGTGSKRPAITSEWRYQARLLLERDGRALDEALATIDWGFSHPYWQHLIRTVPKLRKNYDRISHDRLNSLHTTAPALCDKDHEEPVPAIVRLTWPDGRFKSSLACNDCMLTTISCYVTGDEDGVRHPVQVTDLSDHTVRADLARVQVLAWANKLAHGFNTSDVAREFAYTFAELAEAFDAWRYGKPVAPELADVIIFTTAIARMCGEDLPRAVMDKLAVNAARTYITHPNGTLMKTPDQDDGFPAVVSQFRIDVVQGGALEITCPEVYTSTACQWHRTLPFDPIEDPAMLLGALLDAILAHAAEAAAEAATRTAREQDGDLQHA
jgi:NTP pyrophosphatase (non-canonical NTP hydrolase)